MFRKLVPGGATLLLLLGGMHIGPVAAAPAPQAGPHTWTVTVGAAIHRNGEKLASWYAMKFYPAKLTINEGDTVVWKWASENEPHNVYFPAGQKVPDDPLVEPQPAGPPKLELNPALVLPLGGKTYDGTTPTGSGFIADNIPGPKEYSLTLPKAGNYDYVCTLHSAQLPTGQWVGMVGNITVQAAGSALSMTPEQVVSAAQTEMQADRDKVAGLEAQAKAMAPAPTKNADGTMHYLVMGGYMDQASGLEYQRFIPENLTVHTGDTVEWMSMGFHNVWLGPDQPFLMTVPQAAGPPKVFYNPQVFTPAGGSTFTGEGLYNSGILASPINNDPNAMKSYMLTFAATGTYEFLCSVHDENGMNGHITILTGTMPGMPTTGQPVADLRLVGLFAALLALGGLLVRRRASMGA